MNAEENAVGNPQSSGSSLIVPFAQAVWAKNEDYGKIVVEAQMIYLVASRMNRNFFFGKTKKCVIGGLLYIVGRNYGSPKSQRAIADALSTSDVSIRTQQHRWLSEFPNLFAYVNKIVANPGTFE